MRKRIVLLVVAMAASLSGCGGETKALTSQCLAKPDYPVKEYQSDEKRWEAEGNLQIGDDFSKAFNQFAYQSAVQVLKEENVNGIYSPISLYFAMSAAAAGADGQTRQEILDLLGYESEELLAQDCENAFRFLYQNQKNHKLQIATSFWIDKDFSVENEFLDHGKDAYFAEIFHTDFSDENAGKDMASWVKDHTHGLLDLPVDSKEGQVFSLINTVYYYDEWLDKFDKEKTVEGIFTCGDGIEVTCDFMNRTMDSHWFVRGENYTVSSLFCKNGRMYVLLPDKDTDLWQLLASVENLEGVFKEEYGESMCGEVVWQVPKFSYGSSYTLMDLLNKMGVTAAFSSEAADFSKISQENIWLDCVIQKNHIGIDENGIEAASFTQMDWAGAAMPNGRAEMILDRPFFYVIEEKGCPVFFGICQNPEK